MQRSLFFFVSVAFLTFGNCKKSGIDTMAQGPGNPPVQTGDSTDVPGDSSTNSKDLTKIFVGDYHGVCIVIYQHPSFFVDTLPVTKIIISQIDSTTMRVRFYNDTTFYFENIDTAFADNTLHLLKNEPPPDVITDSGRLIADSLYYNSYRQNFTNFSFISYNFRGSK